MAAVVADGLRKAIIDGDYRPGDRIKQEEVAARFGVSRSPVREALRELAAEGFLDLERDVGARVRPHDRHELSELYLAREALEPAIIAETCRRISPEQLEEAVRLNLRSEQRAKAGDIKGYIAVDRQMHALLLGASGMSILTDLVHGLWERSHRFRVEYMLLDRIETSIVEHRLLLDAIAQRDDVGAADIYRLHTRRTRLVLVDTERDTGPG